MTNTNRALIFRAIERLAAIQQKGGNADIVWSEFERSLTEVFGQRLFTVLAYDEASSRLGRLHSNRLDINPVGGLKRVTQSRWSDQILRRGEIFVGSTREQRRIGRGQRRVGKEQVALASLRPERRLFRGVRHQPPHDGARASADAQHELGTA